MTSLDAVEPAVAKTANTAQPTLWSRLRAMPLTYAISAIAIVLVGAVSIVLLTRSPSTDTAAPADAPASVVATPPPSQPAQAAPPAPAASNQFQLEVVTSRRVWLRIIVDGERSLEQEVEADRRIPLTPQKMAIIRAGDGGAVRVIVNGQDTGAIGVDGFPKTKPFTRPE